MKKPKFRIDTSALRHKVIFRDVGPGEGIPPGKYSYTLRFVDADGNSTPLPDKP